MISYWFRQHEDVLLTILYKKKVKVEREILGATMSFDLNNINNHVVSAENYILTIKICNILRIFRQLYILTSGVRETWQALLNPALCPQDLIHGGFCADATSKLVNKITSGLDLG